MKSFLFLLVIIVCVFVVDARETDPSFEASLYGFKNGFMIQTTKIDCYNSTCPFGIYSILSLPDVDSVYVMFLGHSKCVFQSRIHTQTPLKFQACDFEHKPIPSIQPVYCINSNDCAKLLCEITKYSTHKDIASIRATQKL
jgi:hypothetical protein